MPTIEYRLRETRFLDDLEAAKAKAAIAEDVGWFESLRNTRQGGAGAKH
jgi:hypothetical protein